uniref:Uncharacterized protein n=1 Tax=Zosterops lateralis melanops TaxID=1220523 RepID=A0A8D2P758_ZOSLA
WLRIRQSLTSLKPSPSVTAALGSGEEEEEEEEEGDMNTTREDTGVSEAAQIAVVLVLCLAVTFAILFLGCNLLLQAESLAAPTAQGERRLSEPEGSTEGT